MSSLDLRAAYMKQLLSKYQVLIQLKTSCMPQNHNFWDLVVLSAGNDSQKQWYEMQLSKTLLPPGVLFRVYSDPGGARTGDGGATLNIVDLLYKEFGEDKLEKQVH